MGTLNLGSTQISSSGTTIVSSNSLNLTGNWIDAPTGTVIQLLRHHRGTGQWASTSSSYQVVTNMNKSITPKKAGNLIYVEYHMYVRVYNSSDHRGRCHFEIRDNMSGDNYNTSRSKYVYHWYDYGNTAHGIIADCMQTLTYSFVAPNTTTIDFGIYGRLETGNAMEVNPSNESTSDNSVTIYEIAQ